MRSNVMNALLTDREREIAALAADGLTNAEIARTLYMSLGNVKYHLGRVFRKFGVSRRAQLGVVLQAYARNEPYG
jgi:DNA-binding CsgD family transcriptional regulator